MASWVIKGAENDAIMLGVAEIGAEEPSDPVPLEIKNVSGHRMRGVSVGVRGEARDLVQLAVDLDGHPGVWAAPGEAVTPATMIVPGASFTVWSRIVPPDEHPPGRVGFKINIEGFAV